MSGRKNGDLLTVFSETVEAAPSRLTTVKRVREHAAALRAVWPGITGPDAVELFRRCPPTQHLPSDRGR